MTEPIKVAFLSYRDVAGAGQQIYAHIDQQVMCVEYTLRGDCKQPVLHACKGNFIVGTEPFIQFSPAPWDAMLSKLFQEMVDAWNEKHATKQEG